MLKTIWKHRRLFLVLLCCGGAFALLFCLTRPGTRYDTAYTIIHYREIQDYQMEDTPAPDLARVRHTIRFDVSPVTQNNREILAIYLVHQFAEVRMDGKLVYQSQPLDTWHLGKSPGCYWIFIPLDRSSSQVTLELRPAYTGVVNRAPLIMRSSFRTILRHNVLEEGPEMGIAALCVLLGGIFSLFPWMLPIEGRAKLRLFFLGASTAACGVWRLCDSRLLLLHITVRRESLAPALLSFVSLLGLLLILPLSLTFLLYEKDGNRVYRYLQPAACVVCLAVLIMQLLNIRDIRENLGLISLWSGFSILLLAARCLYALPARVRRKEYFPYEAFYLLLAGAGAVDLVRYYRQGASIHMDALLLVFALRILVVGVLAVREALEQENRIAQARAELADAHTRVLMTQIRPHFIFNTLSSIYYLCEDDPRRAMEVLSDFTAYLQANFTAIAVTEPVPFAEELNHVRAYLAVEQMRLGERLSVTYDTPHTAFHLPALTLQPLVENAVKHALGREPLHIGIQTQALADGSEITVTDNGPGFDPSDPGERVKTGLGNVRERLRLMCGGSLTIASRPGGGTEAQVFLPGPSPGP